MDKDESPNDINNLKKFIMNMHQFLDHKFLSLIPNAKVDFICLTKSIMNKDKEEWKKSCINKDVGILLKRFTLETKRQFYWENELFTNIESIISNNLYDVFLQTNLTMISKDIVVKNIYGYSECHIFFVLDDNTILCKGNNSFGQLGIHTFEYKEELVNFTEINDNLKNNVKKICTGYAFTYFITLDGMVYSTGCGENGRLGINEQNNVCIPKKIEISGVIDIACGSVHAVFLTKTNCIYTTGKQYYNGVSSNDILIPTKIEIPDKIISISCGNGSYHTLALSNNGEVFCWGHNRVGQLGLTSDYIKSHTTSYKIKQDSEGYDWGDEKIPECLILTKPLKVPLDFSVKKIGGGWGHSMVLSKSNKLYVCGRNNEYQLGFNKSEILFKTTLDGKLYLDNFKCLDKFESVKTFKIVEQTKNIIIADDKLYKFGGNKPIRRINTKHFDVNTLYLKKSDYIIIQKN